MLKIPPIIQVESEMWKSHGIDKRNKLITSRNGIFAFFVAFVMLTSIGYAADEKSIKNDKTIGGKIDQVKVIYAVDGYMADSSGESKYFIFGAVKIHKKGAPQDEWGRPLLYFEFDNKKTFAHMGNVDLFRDEGRVRHLYTTATDYNFAKYNREEYASKGLSQGNTPHEFELDFLFNKDGTLDMRSTMSKVPKEYQTGRSVISRFPTDKYYKKGSNAEQVVIIRDAEGNIANSEELGEPVFVEQDATILEICYDYYGSFYSTPTPLPTPIETYQPSSRVINHSYPYNPTGLCSPIYKIQNISRTTRLPDGEALGIIVRNKDGSTGIPPPSMPWR